jgi:hypothetical protein
VIHTPKFIIKIGEYFSQIKQLISKEQHFISLNLKEALKFKTPVKNLGWLHCAEEFNSGARGLSTSLILSFPFHSSDYSKFPPTSPYI